MFNRFLCFLLSFVSLSCIGAEQSVIRQYVHPVILTQPQIDRFSQTVIGSGSVVSIAPGYAITAGHVVPENASDQMLVVYNNKQYKAIPIKIDRVKDLALLSVNIPCPCAPLASAVPTIDSSIYAVGFPLYLRYQIQLLSSGVVQGGYMGTIVASTTAAPGGSGGGLFVKEAGEYRLMGITVAIGSTMVGPRIMQLEQEYNWLTFNVPVDTIKVFLKGTRVEVKKTE